MDDKYIKPMKDDIELSIPQHKKGVAYLFEVAIADVYFAQQSKGLVREIIKKLFERYFYERKAELDKLVDDIIMNRQHMEIIIEDEVRKRVQLLMDEMFNKDNK